MSKRISKAVILDSMARPKKVESGSYLIREAVVLVTVMDKLIQAQ